MSGASEAKWIAAYRKADTLYTARECGCLVLVLVDMPDVIRSSKPEIVREALAGRGLNRCQPRDLPPLHCAAHAVPVEVPA